MVPIGARVIRCAARHSGRDGASLLRNRAPVRPGRQQRSGDLVRLLAGRWAAREAARRAKRRPSTSDGLTRTQAEAELRRLMGTEVVLAGPARKTIEEAGALYVEHLLAVMERKRTSIHVFRGFLRRHLVPFFGARPMDKIDRA